MTGLESLLAALADRGIALTAEGDRLKIDAPAGALTPDLRQALVEHKPALLASLVQPLLRSPETHRIPLEDLSDYLARNKLRVVGGTAFPDGHTFQPTLYTMDDAG